jgi:hypothetical protein
MTARDRWIAGSGFLFLIALHLDFWRPQRVVLYLGWIPEELVYRLCWVALVWVYLFFLTSRLRPERAG